MEGCGFRDRSAEYEKAGVVVAGVSFDEPAANAAFVKKHSFPFPILSDADRSTALAYGASTETKAQYAKRITVVVGADGRVEKIVEKVDVRTHPESLLAELRAAGSGR